MADSEDFIIRLEISKSDGDEVVIKHPMLGMSPYALILPEWDEEQQTAIINVSACDLSREELADMLSSLGTTIRESE